MKVSTFRHWRDNSPQPVDLSFADFARELGTDPVPNFPSGMPEAERKKQTGAFSAVEFQPGAPRQDEYALAVHAAVFDFDGADKKGETEEGVKSLLAALQGDSFVAYSSYSHREVAAEGRYKFRIVLELSRPVPAAQWRGFWRRLGAQLPITHDSSCVNEARIYGIPYRWSEHDFVQTFPGTPIDVDAVLSLPDPQASRPHKAQLALEARLDRKEVKKLATQWAKSKHADTAKRGRLVQALIEGKPYATGETGRHETARELTIFLEKSFPSTATSAITQLFHPSVVSMAADDPGWDIDQRLADIERLIDGAREMRQDAEAEAAAAAEAEQKARVSQARADGKDTPYEAADFEVIAAAQKCTVADLDHRWIINNNGAYYFLTQNGYVGPVPGPSFHLAFREHLVPTSFKCVEFTQFGQRLMAPAEVCQKYGNYATEILFDTRTEQSYFDLERRRLHRRVSPLRKVQAKWFEDIEKYLKLVGGQHYEKLCDYLATVHDLSTPTFALYLKGTDSVGKGLFAHGVASLWSPEGVYVPMKTLVGDFNDEITRNPVIFADEVLPPGVTSGQVREWATCVTWTINGKYAQKASMAGALRLIIGANNDNVITFKKEDMQQADIPATAKRFQYIEVPDATKEHLAAIGGKTRTEEWIAGGDFASHVAWLRETRKVTRGKRWLVEGDAGPLTGNMLAGNGNGLSADLYLWLCSWLDNPTQVANTGVKLVRVEKGEIWINFKAPQRHWGAYLVGSSTPKDSDLINAIKSVCHPDEGKEPKFDNQRFRRVKQDMLWQWAKESGSFDVDALKAKVQHV